MHDDRLVAAAREILTRALAIMEPQHGLGGPNTKFIEEQLASLPPVVGS